MQPDRNYHVRGRRALCEISYLQTCNRDSTCPTNSRTSGQQRTDNTSNTLENNAACINY